MNYLKFCLLAGVLFFFSTETYAECPPRLQQGTQIPISGECVDLVPPLEKLECGAGERLRQGTASDCSLDGVKVGSLGVFLCRKLGSQGQCPSSPKITLKSSDDDPLYLSLGEIFTDPGATAEDEDDGNITASIQVSDNVNTAVAGSYQVTYSVTDSEGNIAVLFRTVTVIDPAQQVQTIQNRVSANSDDAEEESVDGNVLLYGSDLEMVEDDVLQTVGIRFTNLLIPKNATITKATIQFATMYASSESTNLTIQGEKSGYSSLFNTISHDISSRSRTDANVSWSPPAWNSVAEAGTDQQTPDLKNIVQEIVSLPEWDYANAMAFIFTGEGKRAAKAYDNDPSKAPLLHVEYKSGTVTKTMTVSPQTRRMLPLSSTEFDVLEAPVKGTLEIKIEDPDQGTGTYVYVPNSGESGQDSMKFRMKSSVPSFHDVIINIMIEPVPVTLNGVELPNFSSNLPLLILDAYSKTIPDEPKIKGVLTIIPPDESNRSRLGILPEYSDYMEVELRGSSSLYFPKKGYGVDTETADGEDNDPSLLGMPKEHKWVLHGPYSDKSLMRNYIAYNKTRDTGGYAAVRNRYVEVLVQEGNHCRYDGVYLFMEKIKRDGDRVDIEKLKDTDVTEPVISGGYMLKVDRPDDEDWYFTTILKELEVILVYPKTKDVNVEQQVYIEDHINAFENALFSSDYNDPASVNYYDKWIVTDAFAKHILSRELFRDTDTWKHSENMHKDREKKLSMLPVWDFNLGIGNIAANRAASETEGWHYARTPKALRHWMNRLMEDAEFKKIVSQKWCSLRSGPWSEESLNAFIDETKDLLQEAQGRNFQRWPVLGVYVYDNRKACNNGTAYCDTWEKAVEENLRTWLHARAAWMDINLPCEDRTTRKVMINEIYYNPMDGNTSLEFIELYNDEDTQVNLEGWSFASGVELTFAVDANISAKGVLLIANDSSAYSDSIQWTDGKLSNGGEKIELLDENGTMIDIVEYDDEAPWPTAPDGDGPSLELNASKRTVDTNDYGENWHASSVDGGTPGVLP